jgi:parallel beta-helix repeat protein
MNGLIINNTCHGQDGFGIKAIFVQNITFHNNICFNNTYSGLYVLGTNNTVSNNICYGNDRNGIDINGSYNSTFISNYCYENGQNGIGLLGYSNNTIILNIIESNLGYGIHLSNQCENNTISYNYFKANIQGCIFDEGTNNIKLNNICILPAPTITTSSQTITTLNLLIEWTTVYHAHNYSIYINSIYHDSTVANDRDILFTGNGVYTITITAVNEYGESDFSNSITITVDIPPSDPPEAPVITTPSQTIDTDRITIQWSAVSEADNYNVYVDGVLYGTTIATQLEVIFPGDGTYSITVTASNVAGESAESSAVDITVDTTPPSSGGGAIPGFELESLSVIILMSIIISGIMLYRKKKKI